MTKEKTNEINDLCNKLFDKDLIIKEQRKEIGDLKKFIVECADLDEDDFIEWKAKLQRKK